MSLRAVLDLVGAIPKWVLGIATTFFILAMLVSWFTGEPFIVAGYQFGWVRQHAEDSIVNSPRTELEWQQRKYVADEVMRAWPDTETIYECWPRFRSAGREAIDNVITAEEARLIIDGGAKEYRKLFSAIQSILNNFEGISSAYRNGVAARRMFEDAFQKDIVRWYGRLHKFMSVAKDRCDCTWEPFEVLGKEWWKGRPLPEASGIRTGCLQSKESNK